MRWIVRARQLLTLVLGMMTLVGCTTLHEAPAGALAYPIPGHYPPAPIGAAQPRVGVPAPQVQVDSGADEADRLVQDGGDQLFWIAQQTDRFNLVDRARLADMMSQQGQWGLLRPGALMRSGKIDGIDYLLLCTVSDLSVAGEPPPKKTSVAGIETMLHLVKPKPDITTSCHVELRLVNPADGTSSVAAEDDFTRTSPPDVMGLSFATPEAAQGPLRLDDGQMGSVLRIVIDDAMRKMLPEVDAGFAKLPPRPALATSVPSTTQSTAIGATTAPSVAKIRCPQCGFECSPYDEFCPNCGARLPDNPLRDRR
jgi:hypothetical protein